MMNIAYFVLGAIIKLKYLFNFIPAVNLQEIDYETDTEEVKGNKSF